MSDEPERGAGRGAPAFAAWFRVRFHEVDSLGHVNNASYLNYIEQAAIDHATYLGLDLPRLEALGGVFVAHRHEIVFHRPAFAGDLLRVETWLDPPAGARVVRNYRVYREQDAAPGTERTGRPIAVAARESASDLVVCAATEWVFASQTGRPRRIPREVVALFTGADDVASAGQSADRARPAAHLRGH
jgi:acyl-CoA thioester hydrolase